MPAGWRAMRSAFVDSHGGGPALPPARESFEVRLRAEMARNARNAYADNWDVAERGAEPPPNDYPALRAIGDAVLRNRWVRRAGDVGRGPVKAVLRDLLRVVHPATFYRIGARHLAAFDQLDRLLEDEPSRELLVKLIAFRAMGHRRVRLPRHTPERELELERIAKLPVLDAPLRLAYLDLVLELRDLTALGFDLRCWCTVPGAAYVFSQKQYEYARGGMVCKAQAGDVVIDAGACWGDTALYFAHEVGERGQVVSFEFIPSNIRILKRNLQANPHVGPRVTLVPQPLWERPDQALYYVDWGPGSRVSFQKLRGDFPETKTSTTTIDDVVRIFELPRVDFIKMDIEGAELHALKGAEQTIRRFQPKLAISLYHRLEDFQTIPAWLEALHLPYRYYLEHHTIYENETVLFAVPRK
jgi:FkbM family methyltransferase